MLMSFLGLRPSPSTGELALGVVDVSTERPCPVGAGDLLYFVATIPAGQSESGEIDLGSAKLVGLRVPAPWTQADLAFSAAIGAASFAPVFDRYGTEEIVKIGANAAARRVGLALTEFAHLSRFKLRSVLNGAPVAQVGSDRPITLIAQP